MIIDTYFSLLYFFTISEYYILRFVLFIGDAYDIRPNSWCWPYVTVCPVCVSVDVEPLSEAQRQCNDDPSCSMFYDIEGIGKLFALCDQFAKKKADSEEDGTVLYIKRSEYPCICLFYFLKYVEVCCVDLQK